MCLRKLLRWLRPTLSISSATFSQSISFIERRRIASACASAQSWKSTS